MTADTPTRLDPGYRAALLFSALLNGLMFFVEGGVGLGIGSAALLADAMDFLEDTGLYGIAVIAITWSARGRANAALVMAATMASVGGVAIWQIIERLLLGGAPAPAPMAATAALALAVNVLCASRLSRWKRGDAGMRSIWLSTRNDAILNMATVAAAGVVALTASGWADIALGGLIAGVNLWAAFGIARQALAEREGATP